MTGILHAILSFFGVTPSTSANYIEDVFSTYLYTGNGSTQTITNGIDLAGKGGLVWTKSRITGYSHNLVDTARGTGSGLASQSTGAENAITASKITSFNTAGYSMSAGGDVNVTAETFASWTFRKQPKFFDIVTYTGNGVTGRAISHNLGSVPGCIIVKTLSTANQWSVYHRSLGATQAIMLQATNAAFSDTIWNNTTPTSTVFTVGSQSDVNANGVTYVAYLFAHDAGGFGAAGTDNVISCGTFNAGLTTIPLGYEPQFLLFKQSDGVGNWRMVDNMRGWPTSGNPQELNPNLSAAETSNGGVNLTATGFTNVLGSGNWIYIAIRRGPMKTPTTGTSVFSPNIYTGTGSAPPTITTNFPVDLAFFRDRTSTSGLATFNSIDFDRLRGSGVSLTSSSTSAETSGWGNTYLNFASNTTLFLTETTQGYLNASGKTYVAHSFRRAPGFFDEVCYTGTGSTTTFSHNLGVAPELIITKKRSSTSNWGVNDPSQINPWSGALVLNLNSAFTSSSPVWNNTAPTSSVFTVGTADATNVLSATYVAYLFATLAGVSKVGTYTGTGALLTINCGFAAGARFVLIKRSDSTGDWYVWDSARGITSGNDPYLVLNSTAAEVTGTNYVDTTAVGFQVTAAAPAELNASGGKYIFLAIA